MTGNIRYAGAAQRTVELFYPQMEQHVAGFAALGIALSEQLVPPSLLVLRGRGADLDRWRDELAGEYLPAAMVVALPDGVAGLPAALDKPRRPEPVNGWLCRGVTCLEPIADLVQLRTTLKEPT